MVVSITEPVSSMETQAAIVEYTVGSHRPDDGNGIGHRNVGSYKSLDAAVQPRNLY